MVGWPLDARHSRAPVARAQRLFWWLLVQALALLVTSEESDLECGSFIEADNFTDLKDLLMVPSHIFIDIDMVVAYPDTPFLPDLPGTDAFINTLKQQGSGCEINPRLWPQIYQRISQARSTSPFKLVDSGFPKLIKELRSAGKRVLALTMRDHTWRHTKSFSPDLFMQTHALVDQLVKWGVRFDPLPKNAKKHGNHTKAGGILLASTLARGRDLAAIMKELVPSKKARVAIVHSNSRRINGAVEVREKHCLVGLHFTGAKLVEPGDDERLTYFCETLRILDSPPKDCELCADHEPTVEL